MNLIHLWFLHQLFHLETWHHSWRGDAAVDFDCVSAGVAYSLLSLHLRNVCIQAGCQTGDRVVRVATCAQEPVVACTCRLPNPSQAHYYYYYLHAAQIFRYPTGGNCAWNGRAINVFMLPYLPDRVASCWDMCGCMCKALPGILSESKHNLGTGGSTSNMDHMVEWITSHFF